MNHGRGRVHRRRGAPEGAAERPSTEVQHAVMRAYEIMSAPALAVREETAVTEVARLLTQHRIGAVPVVDDEASVVGIVTGGDLFFKEWRVPFSLMRVPTLFSRCADPARLFEEYDEARGLTVGDVMTRNVFCVETTDDLRTVTEQMARRGLRRVPVLCDGRLAGMLSRSDLIQFLIPAVRDIAVSTGRGR